MVISVGLDSGCRGCRGLSGTDEDEGTGCKRGPAPRMSLVLRVQACELVLLDYRKSWGDL
jgi:hypothetical protein